MTFTDKIERNEQLFLKPANSLVIMKLIGSFVCIPMTLKRVLEGRRVLQIPATSQARDTQLYQYVMGFHL